MYVDLCAHVPSRTSRALQAIAAGDRTYALATAWSTKSKRHEPMMMVLEYGKGKIFHTPMGHENGRALQCVGFITTLNRSCEWLATGKVTTKIPRSFPGKDKPSTVK